ESCGLVPARNQVALFRSGPPAAANSIEGADQLLAVGESAQQEQPLQPRNFVGGDPQRRQHLLIVAEIFPDFAAVFAVLHAHDCKPSSKGFRRTGRRMAVSAVQRPVPPGGPRRCHLRGSPGNSTISTNNPTGRQEPIWRGFRAWAHFGGPGWRGNDLGGGRSRIRRLAERGASYRIDSRASGENQWI